MPEQPTSSPQSPRRGKGKKLLDGSGSVVKKWVGFVKVEDFEAEFAKLLGQ